MSLDLRSWDFRAAVATLARYLRRMRPEMSRAQAAKLATAAIVTALASGTAGDGTPD